MTERENMDVLRFHNNDERGNTMKRLALSLLLSLPVVAIAAPTGVVSTGLHYNTVGGGYAFGDFDDFDDVDFDGINLNGSILINDTFFVTGYLTSVESDTVWVSDGFTTFLGTIEVSDMQIGIGARKAISSNADITGTIGLARQRIEIAGISDSDNSPMVRLGVRAMLVPQLEVGAGATYTRLFDDSGFTYDLTAAVYVLDQLAIVGGYTLYEYQDASFWNVGARLSF